MYRFFSKREQQAYCISMIMNSLIASGILYSLFRPTEPLSFLIFSFFSVLAFQLFTIFAPELIQKIFFKKCTPLEEQLMLRRKIKCIKEEIKRINRQPYDKDVFRDY
jgi:hypothetical protein